LLAVSESMINVSPHPVRRAALSFAAWAGAFALGITLLASAQVAMITAEVAVLVVAAYMFRWFTGSIVDYVRAPQLFETPRKSELKLLAHEMTSAPLKTCADACGQVLRFHDPRMALLGLMALVDRGDARPEDLAEKWQTACAGSRDTVLDLLGRYGGRGSTNALFLAQLLCMYETISVEKALSESKSPEPVGRRGRVRLAQRLAKMGRVRHRAEEYGLPVESRIRQEKRAEPKTPLRVRAWPAGRLVSLGFRRRGLAFGISHSLMMVYGAGALAVGRGSGWVFLGVGTLVYMLALAAMSDFADLAGRYGEGTPAVGGAA